MAASGRSSAHGAAMEDTTKAEHYQQACRSGTFTILLLTSSMLHLRYFEVKERAKMIRRLSRISRTPSLLELTCGGPSTLLP